ncbi:MAG TPA: FTR1 family protein [Casimicrobiaceae bacterium]|nr:FTR1 family protein [Casimicrobiaceae bacterium]
MGNALFIVWRESAEAMLVVGILYAWLKQRPDAATGMRFLWGGVAAGAGLALVLALIMLGIASSLSGNALDYFQVAIMLVAAALIVQMVFWMRRHGRTFKKDLEANMADNVRKANWWGLLVVVALAVGRESAEAVVFLYGLGAEKNGIANLPIVLVLGIGAAFATFWLLQQGTRWLSWRVFFRVSETLLLLLAGALIVSGVEKLIALDVLPDIVDPVWNTTRLLDDSGRFGGLIASFTGYRSRPALLPLAALAIYWTLMVTFLRAPRKLQAAPAATASRPVARHAERG